jgi:HEAT repeat protein
MAESDRRKGNDALMLALAAGQTVRDAAGAAGVGERTAKRRLADPAFRHQLSELRAAMVERALGKMADGMAEAADTLRQLLHAKSEPVRLGAARSILELGNRLREAVELEQRLAELEERLAGPGGGHPL